MGDAVDRLRDLVALTIRVPPHIRHVDGKFIHVDAYTRHGKPAEKAPPKPKARMARTIPKGLYAPQDLQTNENVKVAVDTIRQTLVTDLKGSGEPVGDWLADPGTRDTLKSHAYLFDTVRKPTHKAELTKAGKIMAGREWGRYDTMLRSSTLLARMESGSIGKTEAAGEFWDLMDNRLVPKVMGADYPISISQVRNSLIARAKNMGVNTSAHVPEKPTGEEPPEAVPPVTEVQAMLPGGLTPGQAKPFKSEVLDIQAGDEVWIDMQATTPSDAWAIVVKHPDGTAHTISGSKEIPAKVKETAEQTVQGLGVAGSGIKYKHYGTVTPSPEEPAKVDLPGLPGVKVTPPPPGPVVLIPGVITPGVEQIGEWEVKPGDEVYIPEDTATPMQAANLLIRHPDGSAHIIGAAVAGGVMQAPAGIMGALNTPESGWYLYGKVPGVEMMGGKIDVLTIDVPMQSGEGTKKVVVGQDDKPWQGYGGAVGVQHADGTWTVYDLGPDKHVGPGDPSYEAWDKVGKGENPNWQQFAPEVVKAYPPTEVEAAPLMAVKVPTESGKIVTLEPGEKVFQAPIGNVLIGTPDGKITLYTKQKQITMLPGDTDYKAWNQTVSGLKPDSPYQPIEEVEAPPAPEPKPKAPPKPKAKKPKVVIPTVPLDGADLDTLKNPTVSYGAGDGVDQFMTKQRARYLEALTKVQQEMGGGANASDYWINALGKQSTIDLLTEIVGKMETARTDPDIGLEPGQKAKLAKDRKRYEALLEAGTLARDLDTLPEDELDARMTSVSEKLSSGAGYYASGPYKKMFTKGSKAWQVPNWPYNQRAIFPALQTRVEKRLFDVRSEELGFDYMKADDATLASFIADKGAGDIAPWLSTEQKQDWVRVWLRDPSILDKYSPGYDSPDKYAAVLEQITKAATISMSVDKVTKMANLDLHAQPEPEGPDVDQQKAIAAQLVDAQKRYELLKDLKQRYVLPTTGAATHVSQMVQDDQGAWEISFSAGDYVPIEESDVIDQLMNNPKWEADSQAKALTQHMLDEAEAQQLLGMPTGAATRKVQNTWLKDHGASNVGKMTQPEREEWITAHLAQNNLLKFAIEDEAGKKAKNLVPHPGLATHPGSPDSPSGKAAWQLFSDQAAVSVWGDIYRSSGPVAGVVAAKWTPEEVLTFATAMHLDYGFPPDSGGIPEAIARDRVQGFLNRLPGSKLPPPSPGLQTVVPDEPVKGPLTKPDGVSDDAFNLLEALKVVTPDQHAVALFSKTADKFTEEQVDVYLKNSALVGGQNALANAGIYHAPLPVKQALVAEMKGLTEEAPFPEGFMEAIKAQINAGVFDPPKPEGYYGAVSNGETVYYLKPGDKVMEAGAYQTVTTPGDVAGPPALIETPDGGTVALQPGDVAYAFDASLVGQTDIFIRHADGSWTTQAGTPEAIDLTPQEALDNGWEAPESESGVSAELEPVGAGPPPVQTSYAPPKDEVYGYKLEPGDQVYLPPGYSLGSTSVDVLHQDATVTHVSPTGDAEPSTVAVEEWHETHDPHWVLTAVGPTAVALPSAGAFALKTDDVVYQFGSNSSWVKHANGSWSQVAITDTVPIAGAGIVTAGTVTSHVLPGSDSATNLENPKNTIYQKPPLDSPHVVWPEAFTYAYTPTPKKKVGHGPFSLAPDDLVYPAGTGILYVKHADGSWERIYSGEGSADGGTAAATENMPKGFTGSGTGTATVLEEWVKKLKKVPIENPAEKFPDAFTLWVESGPTLPAATPLGHGPIKLKPGDKVVKDPVSTTTVWLIGADGSAAKIHAPNGNIVSEYPAGTIKADTPVGSYPPVMQPGNAYPDAFTEPVPSIAGATVVQPKSVLWVQHADGTGSWITADGVENVTDEQVDGLFAASHPYIPLKPTSLPPKPIETYKQAQEMGLPPGVPPSVWEESAALDSLPEGWSPPDLIATDEEIRTGLLTAKDTFGLEVSIAFVENAPPQVQRALYDHLASGSPPEVLAPLVGVMNWKADNQHWGSKTYKPPFATGKAYTPYILAGLTDESSVASWPYDALQQFQTDYKVNGAGAIASKLNEVLVGKKPIVASMSAANEPLKFSDDPDAGHQGGSHSGNRGIKDQHNNKYLYKIYQNDPQSPAMRVEQEVYAARISQLLGFHHPPVQDPVTVLGHLAYIQLKVPFKFDMQGVHPEDLDDNILAQVAEEHVLDWILANADTYYSNIAVSGDGKHVIGIDKGQAFKQFPNDQLSPTYTGGNPIPPYYNDMYAAVVSHKISKERADAMVRHMLIRAKRISQAHDPEHRALLEKAFASRTDFKGMTKDEFIDALMERKHAAAESFEEMWKGVYAKAGYSWDIEPLDELQFAKVETPRGAAWAGISTEYFEAVEETKVHGRAAMFAGTDLEDGHLLFFEEKDTEGKRVLLGEGKLREAADGRLTAWLQAQKVGDASGSVVTPQAYVLPQNDAWFQQIVAGAMTVNHHLEDQEFNQSHLDAMAGAKDWMEKARSAVLHQQIAQPGTPFQAAVPGTTMTISLPDMDAQKAFLDMIDTYLQIIDEIETAKADQTKTPNKKYTQYVYVPKAKPKVDEEWKSQGFILQKTEDGVWHHIDESTGSDEIISEKQAADFMANPTYTQGSQGKAVTSLQVKVYKRQASRPEGQLDLNTGELKESGGEEHSGASGQEYDVEIGDRIVLEYRPWHGANQQLADQGFFRIRVKNWDGDEADLDMAFQQLAAMGVDLTPADEESLQLLYWRLWEGVASTRANVPAPVQKVLKNIQGWRTQNPNASATEELEFLRSAWKPYLGEAKVEDVDFMPHFDHTRPQNPDEETGHPYWMRPDADLDDMLDLGGVWHFGSQDITYGGSESDKKPIAQSGGLDSSDERLRLYGHWMEKGSSTGDKPKGSTGQVFTRPQFSSSNHIAFVPDVFLRMQTYAASGDKWGNVATKGQYAPFTVDGLKKASTEMMVKHTVTVLDSFIVMRFNNQAERDAVVQWYKDHGIHSIRGVPVEARFIVASSLTQSVVANLWEKELVWRAEQKQAEAALAA